MLEFFATHAPMVGLLFFFTVFLGIVLWVYRPGSKQIFQQQAQIPLKEEQSNGR